MNWRLIFMLASLGIVVAAAALWGPEPSKVTTALSILAALITASTLAARVPGKLFLHGLLAGGLGSLLTSLMEGSLITQYLAHNPTAGESLRTLGHGLSPQFLMFATIPLSAGFSAIFTGLLTLVWGKFVRRKPAEA